MPLKFPAPNHPGGGQQLSCAAGGMQQTELLLCFLPSSCSCRTARARIQPSDFISWRQDSSLHHFSYKMVIITYYQLAFCLLQDSAQQGSSLQPVCSVPFIVWLWCSQKWLGSPLGLWQGCFWQFALVWEVKWHWFHHPHSPQFCKHGELCPSEDNVFNLKTGQLEYIHLNGTCGLVKEELFLRAGWKGDVRLL